MKNRTIAGLISVFLLASVLFAGQFEVQGQSPNWNSIIKRIKIFETDRPTAEKVLKGAKIWSVQRGKVGVRVSYLLKDDSVDVVYSNGLCANDSEYGYNIAKDIVIHLDIRLGEPAKLSRFDFDLKKFERGTIEDIIGSVTYENEHDGIRIYGDEASLQNIHIFPSIDQEKMACENFRKE